MDNLPRILSQYAPQILMILLIVCAVLGAVLVRLTQRMSKMQSRWQTLLEGTRGDNLERLLYDHLKERLVLQEDMSQTIRRVSELEEKMNTSKRHVGLVRYDAFEDVGGSQSFALAIFDDKGDGAVITSLVGRADCRVYCKSLSRGRSERSLSQEEQRAISDAQSTTMRPIITS